MNTSSGTRVAGEEASPLAGSPAAKGDRGRATYRGRTRVETRGLNGKRVRERVREIRKLPVIGRSDQCRSVCVLFCPAGSFVATPSISSAKEDRTCER